MPLVKIKPGLSHGYYDTALKSRAYHWAGDEFDASPAEMESFGDKFILVEVEAEQEITEMPPPPVSLYSSATRGAIGLATEHGISLPLSDITGTGKDGRITKADVQAVLDGDAE